MLTPEQQIDQLCDEFENAIRRDVSPKISNFLPRIGSEHRENLFEQLLLVELDLAKETIDVAAYQSQYPQYSTVLLRLMAGADGGTQATGPGPLGEKQIGPYKILKVLGEGGMGTVYMASQSSPVKRKVALKVIKAGMDSKQIIGRFEAERQALAMMDHHNIAKVLDAGTTDTGRPYFAMEWYKGVH